MKKFIIFSTLIFGNIFCGTFNHKTTNAFQLTSPSFLNHGRIPIKYTGDSENISPELNWKNVPKGTKSFALIVSDPDADKKNWVHWIVFNISPKVRKLPEGIQRGGFVSGITDFYYAKNGIWQYAGPYPTNGIHHYNFTIYALDAKLDLSQNIEGDDLLKAMKDHIIDRATLVGIYEKR